MTIGYHISAKARTVEPINYTSIRDIYAILGCDEIAIVEFGDDNQLAVDDSGLWRGTHFWQIPDTSHPVSHDALLVGPDHLDDDGYDRPTDPSISVETLRSLVEWISRADFEQWIDRHRELPAVSINGECLETWGEFYAKMPKLEAI